MKQRTLTRLWLSAISLLTPRLLRATDIRIDVGTDAHTTDDTNWFGTSQLPYLNFPSANGHILAQGTNGHAAALNAAGNSLSVYYDAFHTLYATDTPQQAVSAIQSWIIKYFGSIETNAYLVLNEVDSSTWNSSSTGPAYRTWLVSTMSALHNAGYNNIVLYAESSLASKTYASTWQSIAQYASIGDEDYIDGPAVVADNFSVSKLQSFYQSSYNAWTSPTSGAGLSASKILLGEHFSINQYAASNYWGADGVSGTQWQAAIEARDIAVHNIPFGGFIGYAWGKNAQATGDPATDLANQIAYEKAYASTLVVQTEIPCWTGNDGTTSWNDYLNWTGGLPSTTAAPFPLLASTNPTLPKQTSANFLNTIHANTIISLDANQSITNLSFSSPYSYTLSSGIPGSSLTLTGASASLDVPAGTHSITAPLILSSNLSSNIAGSLTISGSFQNQGHTLTKSGTGTLTFSGTQSNSPNSSIVVTAGTLNLRSDAGSSTSFPLSLSTSNSILFLNSTEHLASLTLGANSTATTTHLLSTRSLTISPTATLNLTNNDLLLTPSDIPTGLTTLRTYLSTHQLFSSTVDSDPNHLLAIAYAPASLLNLSTYDSDPVTANTVITKITTAGDANLDGKITPDDYALLDRSFAQHLTSAYWTDGDFNYDGIIDQQDYLLIDRSLYQTQSFSPEFLAQRESQFGPTYLTQLLSTLPEPTPLLPFLLFASFASSLRAHRGLFKP